MKLAPIIVFVFRRPLETLQALWSLGRCPEARHSEITIYCDCAKSERDQARVRQVREIVRSQPWLPHAMVVEREQNWGLARSVVDGVTEACGRHGRVIVLEDDLLVSSGLLRYMNEALERYADDPRIMQVSAHSFPLDDPRLRSYPGAAHIIPVGTTWGWATWGRAWQHYRGEPEHLEMLDNPKVAKAFDLDGHYPYTRMLRDAIAGRIDSWGIRWWWAMFQRGGLGVFPFPSLVKNIGGGATATHTSGTQHLLEVIFDLDGRVAEWPASRLANDDVFSLWKRHARSLARPPLLRHPALSGILRRAWRGVHR